MNLAARLKAAPGRRVRLVDHDPRSTPGCATKKAARPRLEENLARLADLQYLLYAENRRSLLVVLQAVDAGGKDGTIRHVMSGLNPQGCRVTPFKVPSTEERE
ncbi:MAG TPA: polyphosphate kinase 2 family protein, partial [Candidatus Polarisedimenticolia bacterium]